jgi:hypothetical protein
MTKIRASNPQLAALAAKAAARQERRARSLLDRDGDGEVRGRNTGKGTPDDSIGRNKGTPDDSIGKKQGKGALGDLMGGLFGKDTRDGVNGRGSGRPQEKGGLEALLFGVPTRNGSRTNPSSGSGLPIGALSSFALKGLDRATDGVNERSRKKAEQLLARPAAKQVLGDTAFQALPAHERAALINLMSTGGEAAATGLARLVKDGRLEAVLHATDSAGTSVLANLERIAASGHAQLAGDVLDDLSRPAQVEQGFAPTCTAASMQYELAKERPAEYARLMEGLAVDGRVTMQGGGELALDVDKAIRSSDARRDFRSDSEAVFQSAVMDFANGAARYDLDKQLSVDGAKAYRGLYPDQIREALGQLFGARYTTVEILDDDMARRELEVIASRERPNRPVLFDLNMGSFNHNVSLERVTDKMVFYRDPTTGDVKGMDRAEFIKRLTSVHYAEG